MSTIDNIGGDYAIWRLKYDKICRAFVNQPNITELKARHPVHKDVGLKLLTIQIAQIAYLQSTDVDSSLSDSTTTQPVDVKQPIIEASETKTSPGSFHHSSLSISKSQQKIFAYLQIRCNELLVADGMQPLPLLRLTPLMLIDLDYGGSTNKSNQSSCDIEREPSEQNIKANRKLNMKKSHVSNSDDVLKHDIRLAADGRIEIEFDFDEQDILTSKPKKKSQKKMKKNTKALNTHPTVVNSTINPVDDKSDNDAVGSYPILSCIDNTVATYEQMLISSEDRSLGDHGAGKELLGSSLVDEALESETAIQSHDEVIEYLASSNRSLPRDIHRHIISTITSSNTINPLALTKTIVSGYEDAMSRWMEAHEDKMQALYMRLFIAESSFESEKESFVKQIEHLRISASQSHR